MRYYPIFVDLEARPVIFSGAGTHAAAKIRLLLKTTASITVFGTDPCDDVREWARRGHLRHVDRPISDGDADGAALVYGANDDLAEDRRAVAIGKTAGALTNIVDNLAESAFLTPAIVDRDPVTVAIGTEGTAPVLARRIKSQIEALMPSATGVLARVADRFRPAVAGFASGRKRREFWARYFDQDGPRAYADGGEPALHAHLEGAIASDNEAAPRRGHVSFVGAGPGDPELVTLKARRALHTADVVLHDQLVTAEILELARREAVLVNVGKRGYGKSRSQDEINALLVDHAKAGRQVVRLKSGDPAIFGRLDEELDALDHAGIAYDVVPGVTAAAAGAAALGASLTRRGRNASLSFVTGHDADGFADQDWAKLARPGAVAAIYMGLKAARFIGGRLLMHGARAATPVTVAWNLSRPDQALVRTTIGGLAALTAPVGVAGPAILLLGLEPRKAARGLGDAPISRDTLQMTGTR